MLRVLSAVWLVAAVVLVAEASAQTAPRMVRRVVTGNDANGRSHVVSDERVPGPPAGNTPNLFRTDAKEPLGKSVAAPGGVLPFEQLEITLAPGDVDIQRNTRHAWRNASTTAPVTAWVVLVATPASVSSR